tara:strand:+ start:243 stop:473 length:231 start_codon:yes stop_codon:yes gene_type:complete
MALYDHVQKQLDPLKRRYRLEKAIELSRKYDALLHYWSVIKKLHSIGDNHVDFETLLNDFKMQIEEFQLEQLHWDL